MSYKPRSLSSLIEAIENRTLLLPHIQRAFVWDREQMVRLFDSLMRNYPIQTLLTWRTKDEIKARRFMEVVDPDAELSAYYDKDRSKDGVEKTFVLDGQQRLQTLHALFAGGVLDKDGTTRLEAWTDLASGELPDDDETLRYKLVFAKESPGVTWYRLRDLRERDTRRPAEEITETRLDAIETAAPLPPEAARLRQRAVRRNVSQLASLLFEDRHFWIEELDGVASDFTYRRVLEIFIRVNSGGTRLDQADLMFATMKEDWSEVEERVESVVGLLNETGLEFDKNLVLKCLVVAHGRGAEVGPEKFSGKAGDELLDLIEASWPRAEAAFQQLRDFIRHDLRLYGPKVVRSYSSFVPLFDFLFHNPAPDEASRRRMRAYFYKAQLFNWFRVATDSILTTLHLKVGTALASGFPLEEIKVFFRDSGAHRAPVELQRDFLSDMRLRHIVLNIVYVEKFGTSPFDVAWRGNEPHIDHVYPQSALRTKLKLPTEEINHLGNYRFVGATDNIRKRAELPADYFSRLKAQGIDLSKHLLLEAESREPQRLIFDAANYRHFRDRRLDEMYELVRKVVDVEVASP